MPGAGVCSLASISPCGEPRALARNSGIVAARSDDPVSCNAAKNVAAMRARRTIALSDVGDQAAARRRGRAPSRTPQSWEVSHVPPRTALSRAIYAPSGFSPPRESEIRRESGRSTAKITRSSDGSVHGPGDGDYRKPFFRGRETLHIMGGSTFGRGLRVPPRGRPRRGGSSA